MNELDRHLTWGVVGLARAEPDRAPVAKADLAVEGEHLGEGFIRQREHGRLADGDGEGSAWASGRLVGA